MKKLLIVLLVSFFFNSNAQDKALNFDGNNDCVDLGNQVANGLRSIELWFKPQSNITSLSDAQGLIYRWNNGNSDNVGLYIGASNIGDNGKIVFQRNIGTTNYKVVSNSSTWAGGVWYHVAAVIDPINGMELYINGVKQSDTDPSTSAASTTSDRVLLARWGGFVGRHFEGSIDEVRVWDKALLQTEINSNKCDTIDSSLQTGLKGYWRLDEGTGTSTSDNTGNGFIGTLAFGPIWEPNLLCPIGTALDFDGTNDCVVLGTQVANGLRSIELWFKPETNITSLSDAQGLIYRWNNGNFDNVGLYIGASNIGDNGKIVFQRNIGSSNYKVVSDSSTWTGGVWYHVAAVIDPTNGMELYIDGVKQSDTNSSTAAAASASGRMLLGRWGDFVSRHFEGSIDEVRVWDKGLLQTEINSNKCDTIDSSLQTGLRGYWRLDEGAGTSASDNSGNGLTGTLAYGPIWEPSLKCNTILGLEGVDLPQELNVNVYPNPTLGQVNLDLANFNEHNVSLNVYNLAGKLVYQEVNINSINHTFDISSAPTGLYLIELKANNKVSHFKLIKQ